MFDFLKKKKPNKEEKNSRGNVPIIAPKLPSLAEIMEETEEEEFPNKNDKGNIITEEQVNAEKEILNELSKQSETPKSDVKRGRKPKPEPVYPDDDEELNPVQELKKKKPRIDEETIDIDEDKDNINGKGFMFAVKNKYIKEATRLNDREITSMSINYAQEASLDQDETRTPFEVFADNFMHLRISKDGLGRTDYTDLAQIKADEQIEKASDAFGRP
jgi:hypothetical protein